MRFAKTPSTAAVLSLLLLAACQCGETPSPAVVTPPLAQVLELQGDVQTQRGDAGFVPATLQQALERGDRIRTGAGASVVIRYRNGAELAIGENSRLRLEEPEGRLALRLEEGQLLSRSGGSGTLLLLMSDGSAEVIPGTELRLVLGPEGEERLDVVNGGVLVLRLNGEKTEVVAGGTLNLMLAAEAPVDAGVPEEKAPEPIVLTLSPLQGAPQLKARDAKKYVRAPETPSPLEPGTRFQLPKGARALLESETLKLSLESGSRGGLVGAEKLEEDHRHELEFDQGDAQLDFPGETSRTLVLNPAGKTPLKARVTEPTRARLSKTKKSTRLEVRTGKLTLELNGQAQELEAGQVATITGDRLSVAPARPPALVLSPSRRIRVYVDRLEEVGLDVPEGLEGSKLEVAADEAFKEPLLVGRAPAKVAIVDAPVRGSLHWRFLDPTGQVLREGSARFEPDRGRSVLNESAPQAEVTETGLKASVYFQSAPPALRLTYLEREGAKQYRVRLYAAGDMKTPLLEKVVAGTTCTLESGQVREGSYVWYAAPLDVSGNEMAGGRMNKLELVYDNLRRGVAIARPRPNERVGRGAIPTRGVAPLGAKLYVNGRAVPLDEKGRFNFDAPNAESLVYRLVEGSTENYWVRSLRRGK